MSLPVAILAGGLATRLRPITERIPKSLVDVAGQPFAVHQIELLRRHGLTDIAFLVGHLGEMIRDTLGDGTRWGVRLRYVFDGPRPLGTGGAIRRALPQLGDAFFVLYGDSYLECDYAAIEARVSRERQARPDDRLIATTTSWDRSNVLCSTTAASSATTSSSADARDAPHRLRPGRLPRVGVRRPFARTSAFDLADVYQDLLAARTTSPGYEVPDRFYEIGSPEGSKETRALPGREAKGDPPDELRDNSISTKRPAIIGRPRRGRDREDGDAAGRAARARRPPVLSSASAAAPANCSHAVNDFRKIAGIEAYTPTDNVSELTARTNDEGWETSSRPG